MWGWLSLPLMASYVIEGLKSGNYMVCAFANGFLGEYYEGVSSCAAATLVNVS